MKKTIIAAVMGMAASAAMLGTAQGQGYVVFGSYNYSTDAKVTHSIGGAPVDQTFSATLSYQYGTNVLTDLAGVQQSFRGAVPLGYFDGVVATIPGYSSGPITFVVHAFNTASYATATELGDSAPFTLAGGISSGSPPPPAGEFGAGFLAFTVHPVPEPSTFALLGLGTGALLFLRRRK